MLFDFVWGFLGGGCLPFFMKSGQNMPEYAFQRE